MKPAEFTSLELPDKSLVSLFLNYDFIIKGSFARNEPNYDDIDCILIVPKYDIPFPRHLNFVTTSRNMNISTITTRDFKNRVKKSPRSWCMVLEGIGTSVFTDTLLRECRQNVENKLIFYAMYLYFEEVLMGRYKYSTVNDHFIKTNSPGNRRTLWRTTWMLKSLYTDLSQFKNIALVMESAYEKGYITRDEFCAAKSIFNRSPNISESNKQNAENTVRLIAYRLGAKIIEEYMSEYPEKTKIFLDALSENISAAELKNTFSYLSKLHQSDYWVLCLLLSANRNITENMANQLWQISCNDSDFGLIARHLLANPSLPLGLSQINYKDIHKNFFISQRKH